MKTEQLLKYLELIREFIVISALLIGAFWGLFLFVAEQRGELAQLNKNKMKMENLSFHEQWQPNLDIALTVSSHISKTSTGFLIQANAEIVNKGKLKGEFQLGKSVFSIYSVKFDDNGKPLYGRASVIDEVSMPGNVKKAMLLPNEKASFPFIHYTKQPGIYYIEFMIIQHSESLAIWPTEIIKPEKEYTWAQGQFVEVGELDEKS
jgi:hypothetical protein